MMKLNSNGGLEYSTLLGGDDSDFGSGIALDALGNVYVTGSTQSTDFPTQSSFQDGFAGFRDVFIGKIAPDGSFIEYSSFLGGSGRDSGNDIGVDIAGNVYIAGTTSSNDSIAVNPNTSILLGDRVLRKSQIEENALPTFKISLPIQ